jgi:2',3'-cyclic-nucleotide 2'-phosphodiesterase / 3'-nucleotidase
MTRSGTGLRAMTAMADARSASGPVLAVPERLTVLPADPAIANAGPLSAPKVALRILATSDLHANLLSYDYSLNRPVYGQGLVQAASLISAAREENPQAILLDNGDFLQGNALADMASERRSSRPHPVITAMNAMGYDAAALGNHEFNFGLPLLDRAMADASFPILSANIIRARGNTPLDDSPYAPPYALIQRLLPDQNGEQHRVNIGIIGLTPEETLQWDNRHLKGKLDARPMVEAALAWIPALRKAGADLVICLAHTGIPQGWAFEEACHAGTLSRMAGVDALVAGHTHRVFPFRGTNPAPDILPQEGTIGGKPVVQPGFNGSHLGVIDLTLEKTTDGWRVASGLSQALSVSEIAAGLSPQHIRNKSEALRKAILPDHRATLAWARRPLGQTTVPMSTFFAQGAWVPVLALIAASKIDYAQARLKDTVDQSLPVLAAVAAYRTGGRGGVLNYSQLPAGDLAMRHVLDLLPFPNSIVVHRITGAGIREMLERSAAAFCQIAPGIPDQPLINRSFPYFHFTLISGLSFQFDLTQPCRYSINGTLTNPAARRVVGLTRNGRPVRDEMPFLLVSNSYRTGGATGLFRPRAEDVVVNDSTLCTRALRDYLQALGPITPGRLAEIMGEERWGLKPVPGANAFLDTGTHADEYRQEAAHLRPEFVGLTDYGFRRYRLHL